MDKGKMVKRGRKGLKRLDKEKRVGQEKERGRRSLGEFARCEQRIWQEKAEQERVNSRSVIEEEKTEGRRGGNKEVNRRSRARTQMR